MSITLLHILYGFGQMYNDMYLPLFHHTEYFHCPKYLCAFPILHSPQQLCFLCVAYWVRPFTFLCLYFTFYITSALAGAFCTTEPAGKPHCFIYDSNINESIWEGGIQNVENGISYRGKLDIILRLKLWTYLGAKFKVIYKNKATEHVQVQLWHVAVRQKTNYVVSGLYKI